MVTTATTNVKSTVKATEILQSGANLQRTHERFEKNYIENVTSTQTHTHTHLKLQSIHIADKHTCLHETYVLDSPEKYSPYIVGAVNQLPQQYL